MKLFTSIITAVATLAAAGAASASIPGDGGYTDGLRVVYETPITARSVVVHERYYRCRDAEQLRARRRGKTTGATAEKWCRFMPKIRQETPAAAPESDGPQGSILSVPLDDWTPL